MNDMAKILCGSDDDCLRELGEVLKLYRDLHGAGEDIDISVDFDRKVFPLISSISDPRLLAKGVAKVMRRLNIEIDEDSVLKYITGEAGIDERGSIALYIYRRLFYRAVRKRLGDVMWDRDRCPICGLAPIAGIAKKVSHGIYARTVLELRCLCGYSWDYDLFRCPACGNRDRSKFEVLILSGINIHKCIACGHIVGVVSDSPYIDRELIHIAISYIIMRNLEISLPSTLKD
jgi:hypothetical protein